MAPVSGAFLLAMTQYDLLVDEDCLVFAVNCREEDSTLHCGALYLEPLIPHQSIRLSHKTGRLEVELPGELRNQSQCIVAWDLSLQLKQHEQVL